MVTKQAIGVHYFAPPHFKSASFTPAFMSKYEDSLSQVTFNVADTKEQLL